MEKYPITSFALSWDQDGIDYRNGTGFSIMTAKEMTAKEIKEIIEKQKITYTKKYPSLSNFKCETTKKEPDSWVCEWFNHKSLTVFETEAEAFKSFSEFVIRTRKPHSDNSHMMGADEKWRWKYCQCEHCKKQKVTRINH